MVCFGLFCLGLVWFRFVWFRCVFVFVFVCLPFFSRRCRCCCRLVVVVVERLVLLKEQLLLEKLTLANCSLIFVGTMCVLVRPMRMSLFLAENGETSKCVVGFLSIKETLLDVLPKMKSFRNVRKICIFHFSCFSMFSFTFPFFFLF